MSFVAVGVRDDALVAYVDRGGLAHHDELPYGTADKKAHIVGQMFVVLAGRRPRPAVPLPPRGCGVEAAARTSSQSEAAASVVDALPLHGNALVATPQVTSTPGSMAPFTPPGSCGGSGAGRFAASHSCTRTAAG